MKQLVIAMAIAIALLAEGSCYPKPTGTSTDANLTPQPGVFSSMAATTPSGASISRPPATAPSTGQAIAISYFGRQTEQTSSGIFDIPHSGYIRVLAPIISNGCPSDPLGVS